MYMECMQGANQQLKALAADAGHLWTTGQKQAQTLDSGCAGDRGPPSSSQATLRPQGPTSGLSLNLWFSFSTNPPTLDI